MPSRRTSLLLGFIASIGVIVCYGYALGLIVLPWKAEKVEVLLFLQMFIPFAMLCIYASRMDLNCSEYPDEEEKRKFWQQWRLIAKKLPFSTTLVGLSWLVFMLGFIKDDSHFTNPCAVAWFNLLAAVFFLRVVPLLASDRETRTAIEAITKS